MLDVAYAEFCPRQGVSDSEMTANVASLKTWNTQNLTQKYAKGGRVLGARGTTDLRKKV